MSFAKDIRHILHRVKRKVLYDNKVVPTLYLLACRLRLVHPSIVVYVDGGICSQMHQYLLGRYYAELGMKVEYDLSWYQRNGKDNDGIHSRIFELTELWPELEFRAANRALSFYAHHFPVTRNGFHFPLDIEPPKYLHGYYFFDDNEAYRQLFNRYFSWDRLAPLAKSTDIDSWTGTRCALHVRRGDLAKMDDYFYGKVSSEYFHSAIEFIASKYEAVKFFIFSDGFDWVEKALAPFYSKYPHELMKGNLAHEDLNLMSRCDCFISSQGSAGKFAAMINGKGLLIVGSDPHDAIWKERYPNTISLNQPSLDN